MANKVTIEVEARFVDNVSGSAGSAEKSVEQLGKAAKQSGKQLDALGKKKANPEVSADSSKALTKLNKMESKLRKLGMTKAAAKLEAIDNATQKISAVIKKGLALAKEKFNAKLGITDSDSTLTKIQKVAAAGKSVAGKVWSVTMRVLDKATAPLLGILNILKNPLIQAGAVLGVSFGIKDTVDTYSGYSSAISQVAATMGTTVDQIKELDAKAKELGANTKFTATESAEGLNVLAAAGLKAKEQIAAIPTVLDLASAGNISMDSSASYIVGSVKGFSDSADNAQYYADLIAKGATLAKTSVGELGESFSGSAATAATYSQTANSLAISLLRLAEQNVVGAEASTALNRAMADLYTPTTAAKKKLDELGVSAYTSEGKARDFNAVVNDLNAALSGMSDAEASAAKDTILTTYGLQAFNKMVVASDEKIEEFSKGLENAFGSAARQAATQLDNLSGDMTLLSSAADGVKLSIGEKLSPYLREFVQWLTAKMPDIEAAAGKAIDYVIDKAQRLASTVKEFTSSSEWANANIWGKLKIAWDKIIAEPFSAWWDSTGRAWIAGKMNSFGETLGSGISAGLLALLGFETGDALADGKSIGGAFLDGFMSGFDTAQISAALKNWADEHSGILTAAGIVLGGKLISGIAQGVSQAVGLANNLKGLSSGKSGSAASAVSSLGGYATATMRVTAGVVYLSGSFGSNAVNAAGRAMSSGLPALTGNGVSTPLLTSGSVGAAATGGSALGGASSILLPIAGAAGGVIGGATLISGVKDLVQGIKEDDTAKKASAAWKMGGVATGAAIGTAILPGIGTLIGAGVGGLAGWLGSSWSKKKIAEAEQKAVEEAQKRHEQVAAENALRLAEAEREAAIEAERLIQTNLDKHFGDLTLSADELSKAVQNLFGSNVISQADSMLSALSQTENSLSNAKAASDALRKSLWLNSHTTGNLSASQVQELADAAEAYSSSAQKYLEDARYTSALSIETIMGDSEKAQKLIEQSTKYFDSMGGELSALTEQLNQKLADALQDNVITLDEQASIDKLRAQISDITQKLAQEDYETELNIMSAKLKSGNLTAESWQAYTAGVREQRAALYDTAWQAYGQGAKGLDESGKQNLLLGTYDKLNANLMLEADLELGNFRDQYADELGILGRDIGSMLNRYTLPEIESAAAGLSDDTRGAMAQILDWMSPTVADAQELAANYKALGASVPEALQSYLRSAEFYKALADGPEAVTALIESWEIKADVPVSINPAFDEMNDLVFDVDANVNADWTYNAFDDAWLSPDKQYKFSTSALVKAGWTYNPFDSKWISPDEKYEFGTSVSVTPSWLISSRALVAGDFGIKSSYSFSTALNITGRTSFTTTGPTNTPYSFGFPTRNEYRGGIVGLSGYEGFAAGGMVRGGAQLIKVAEEGSPEMIIPLSSQRRERGLKLWEKAGQMLDVPGFARGGVVGGSEENGISLYSARDNSPVVIDGGETVIQVDIGGITIQIDANGSSDVVEAIEENQDKIAAIVAAALEAALKAQFANTPAKGGCKV